MELFFLPIVLIGVYYALYYYFTRTFDYWKKKNVPGPQPEPIFGNLKDSTLRRKNIGVVCQELYNSFPNEKVIGIYRMTTPCLLLRDLEIIKHVMIKDFDLFTDRGVEFSNKGLGVNLFHTDGATWRTLRNKFTPMFTSSKLKNMFYLIDERADSFVDYLQAECRKNSEQEIRSLIQKFTVASISACAFGVDIDTNNDKMDALKMVDRLALIPSYANEVDMMYPGILKKLNLSIFPAAVKDFFNNLVKNIIYQRGGKPTNRNDFMDLILEMRQQGTIEGSKTEKVQISDDIIAAQAFVFYVAGYETSSTTICYLLHALAVNQHIQDKLLTEIDDSLAANNGKITYDSLKEMKYLEKTMNETLRMNSIVEPLQRRALADYHVPGTDIIIPKGTVVIVSARGIHHDEKYFPNPEVFDPERSSPELASKRHPCSYLPFGIGPRNCIGMRFGNLQSRLCIAKLLSKFRVELAHKTKETLEVDPNRIIVGPKGDIYLKFIPRH